MVLENAHKKVLESHGKPLSVFVHAVYCCDDLIELWLLAIEMLLKLSSCCCPWPSELVIVNISALILVNWTLYVLKF